MRFLRRSPSRRNLTAPLAPTFLPLVLALCWSQPDLAAQPATEPGARAFQRQFEGIYESWREATRAKDYKAWSKVTAAYRQRDLQNRIISQHGSFPRDVFAVPVAAPPLANLTLIEILKLGPTACAVYLGRPDFGLSGAGSAPQSFFVLRFAEEDGQWRFDNIRVIKFGSDGSLLEQLRRGDLSFLESPDFMPAGKVPPLAKAVAAPDYLAELWVTAVGYDVTIEVEDRHRSRVRNNSGRDLVIGGLASGFNGIRVLAQPDPDADPNLPPRVEVAIYASKSVNDPPQRVFHFLPSGEAVPEKHESTVRMP